MSRLTRPTIATLPSRAVRGACAILPLALSMPFEGISAQDPAGQMTEGRTASCEGRIISEIAITPIDPTMPRVPSGLGWLAKAIGVSHTTTSEGVVESFLLLDVGEPCTERRRAESERILRLQPFLAEATVRAVPDASGGTRIEVETVDEIPTELRLRMRGARPSELRLGNGNVAGQGLSLAASVERGFAYRTGVGLYATAHQILGRPYTVVASAERAPLGSTLKFGLSYPFFTDLQRSAWYLGHDDVHRYVAFVRPEGEDLSLDLRRRFWDVGGVRRLGLGRHSAFVGALVTHEDMEPASRAVIVSDSGLVADTSDALAGPIPSYRNLRLNAVFGARALSFMRVRGFDALMGVQDVATGIQLGLLVGRGVTGFGSLDDDVFVAADLYTGLGSPASFTTLRVEFEARRDHRADLWDSMVGSGRLAWYLKPADAHVLVSSVELAGAWRERVPFQLRLGDRQGGVRGHAASRVGGGVRSVVRIEERWRLGRVTEHAAVGLATFIDVGRVWAGDAPIGTDSDTEVGVGLGLLMAFPPQSQRLWRLDVAVPVGPDPDARWEVRFSGVRAGPFWREPNDIRRVRASASPSTIFTWR